MTDGNVLRRTVREFREDNLTDWAAALTYYGILAIFPMLIVLVSILGLVGTSATQPLIDNLGKVAPGPAQQIFTSAITNLQKSQGTAGVLFVVGLVGALWSASGYVAAFMRASNAIYDVEEGRPIWKTAPVRVSVTLVLVVLLAVSAVAVVLTGGLAKQVGNVIGVGSSAVTASPIPSLFNAMPGPLEPVTPNDPYGPARRSATAEPIVLRSMTPQWLPAEWSTLARAAAVSLDSSTVPF